MASCSLRRVVYMNVNFVDSIASQFLPSFNSDRKLLLVAGFATISTSSLDSSANMSLSSVSVINGFLLTPEVCLCEFARVDGLPVFPFPWQTEAARRRKHQNDRNDFISKSSNGDAIHDVAWLKSYKPRSWFILSQTTVFGQSARSFYRDYVIMNGDQQILALFCFTLQSILTTILYVDDIILYPWCKNPVWVCVYQNSCPSTKCITTAKDLACL